MCNLYRMKGASAEIAQLFGAREVSGANVAGDIYPGYPGLVIADGQLRSMAWGFPLSLKGKSGQPLKPRPVNNARSDKLEGFMWKDSFHKRRCLIPVSEFAEAEGPKGKMTRTWLSLPDQPMFAVAGIWRDSAKWGPVYSMVMTDACQRVAELHNRMPAILLPDHWAAWLNGPPEQAMDLCAPYSGEMALRRTSDRWVAKSTK